MRIGRLSASLLASALLFAAPPAFADKPEDLAAIKKLVETEMEGALKHDIDRVMSVYWHSKEFVLYDAVPGKFVGWDALKADYEDYFKTFPGQWSASHDELHVGASGDTGYAFSIQTWKFMKADGQVVTAVQRVTNIYRKIDGRWQCVHEHASLPADLLNKSGSK